MNKNPSPVEHLYIHIPFCASKCKYCDFVSFSASPSQREAYLRALAAEARQYRARRPRGGLKTVYFGGGTPSLLTIAQFEALLRTADEVFGLAPDAEISSEANPDSVNEVYLRELRELGVNRLSLGAQSFDDNLLRAMGRRHDRAGIQRAADAARKAGFENFSLDLIYGLPHQTMDQWRDTLAQAVALGPTHISDYGLKLSPASPWGRACPPLPDDELNAEMQLYALDYLEAQGYPWYEVANCARPGLACRHNLAYWQRRDYLGLGLAAASLLDGERRVNCTELPVYLQAMAEGRPAAEFCETLTAADLRCEEIMLALRLRTGLDLEKFRQKYDIELLVEKKGQMVKFFQLGLVKHENACLKLCNQGIPVHNEILLALMD